MSHLLSKPCDVDQSDPITWSLKMGLLCNTLVFSAGPSKPAADIFPLNRKSAVKLDSEHTSPLLQLKLFFKRPSFASPKVNNLIQASFSL